jgi:hypothetical protein
VYWFVWRETMIGKKDKAGGENDQWIICGEYFHVWEECPMSGRSLSGMKIEGLWELGGTLSTLPLAPLPLIFVSGLSHNL